MTQISGLENWENSYHGRLRAQMGDATLFFLGARGVIRDEDGRFLLIQRADNGYWAFPAGAMELGESMAECAIRETYEETGLRAGQATLFALLTGAQYTFKNMYGDTYQHVSGSYLLNGVSGEVRLDPEEASDFGWYAADALPDRAAGSVGLGIRHLREFERTGLIIHD